MSVKIYCLCDPNTGEIRYVGKTKSSLTHRLKGHLSDVRRGRIYIPRHKWIHGLISNGGLPTICLLEDVDEAYWQEAEQFWIAYLRFIGCKLLNATAGGDGLHDFRHTQLTKRKQSAAAKRRYTKPEERAKSGEAVRIAFQDETKRSKLREAYARRGDKFKRDSISRLVTYSRTAEGRAKTAKTHRGKTLSAETRAKISAARMGQKRSPEAIRKTAEAHRGRTRSEETKAKIAASRRVYYAKRRELQEALNVA